MDAADAGDIAGGRHHAAPAATDDHGLVGKRGVVALLDGSIEGVAVEMGDGQRVELGMGNQARAAAMPSTRRRRRGAAEAVEAEG
jgi:hypothetical protein